MDRDACVATRPWGHKESDTTERLNAAYTHTHTHTHTWYYDLGFAFHSNYIIKIHACMHVSFWHAFVIHSLALLFNFSLWRNTIYPLSLIRYLSCFQLLLPYMSCCENLCARFLGLMYEVSPETRRDRITWRRMWAQDTPNWFSVWF